MTAPAQDTNTVTPDIPDSELVDRLIARDNAAFRIAVARYSGPMLATARAVDAGPLAEDVVQDAWLAALQALPSFEHRASLKTWLQRIVANKAISRLRSQREFAAGAMTLELSEDGTTQGWFDARGHWVKAMPPAWHNDSPDALLQSHVLQECLDKHLGLLPAQQRDVVALRDLQGMELDDICQVVNVSAANVRVLLHRARLKLVSMVNHYEATGEC